MKSPESAQTEQRGIALAMDAFSALSFAFRDQPVRDFGIDAQVELIENGEATGRLLGLQIKAGPSYFSEWSREGFVFRTDRKHIKYWIDHILPVLICLCDIETKEVYWQEINAETAISTGSGYKIVVPKNNKVDRDSSRALSKILTSAVAKSQYAVLAPTIVAEEDVSFAGAKRYSIKAVLNDSLSKAETASVVRQLTEDGKKNQFHRNQIVESMWGNSEAHVVWTFVYRSMSDFANDNYLCRSQWINPDLSEKFRPVRMNGEYVGNDVVLDWNPHYETMSRIFAENAVAKGPYLAQAVPLTTELKAHFEFIDSQLASLSKREMTEAQFLENTHGTRTRIEKIDREIMELPVAPFECKDFDGAIAELGACVGNIALHYSEQGFKTWDERGRLQNSLVQSQSAPGILRRLEVEIEKFG